MAITCPHCRRQYDSTLFEYGQLVRCDCGKNFDISQGNQLMMSHPIECVLIDITGVLYVGKERIPGAAEALCRLQESALPVRYDWRRKERGCIDVEPHAVEFRHQPLAS